MGRKLRIPYPEVQGTRRPYLVLHLLGPNGAYDNVTGLVDSGADFTCLPLAMARLLGYGRRGLREKKIQQVSGSLTAYQARQPLRAALLGQTLDLFELMPVFIEGCQPLWGRADFFTAFRSVAFAGETLELTTR